MVLGLAKKEKWIKYTGGMKEKEEKPSSCSG
jgi:hypothetical protein